MLVTRLCPKSNVSIKGIVSNTSGNWVNWLELRFNDTQLTNWFRLSGNKVNLLCDKSNAKSEIKKNG